MPGQPVHFEIPADDTAKGRQFWGSLFGWQFEATPGPFEYHMTRISDQAGAAITNMEPGKRGIRPYFDVDDINAGAARVKELGGEANDPGSVPGMGWFATCRDPRATSSACGTTTRPAQPNRVDAAAAGAFSHQGAASDRVKTTLVLLARERPRLLARAWPADHQQRPVSKGQPRSANAELGSPSCRSPHLRRPPGKLS